MKKIGLFLSARADEGGMFQYSQAVLAALLLLPPDQYSLTIAYAAPVWREHLTNDVYSSLPLHLGKLTNWLTMIPAFLPVSSHRRWDRSFVTQISGWADDLSRQACDLWVFPRQEVWSALFPHPVLAAVHDLMHRYEPHFPETSSFGRSRYRDAYLYSLCQNAGGILVDSEMGRRHVAESYGTRPERLFVLPYIAPAYLAEAKERELQDDVESRFQLPTKYVFYPAQFWKHKNHLRLIQAMAHLKKIVPDVCLVLAGSKKHGYQTLLREVERLGLEGRVRFAGYVPETEMAEFYRRARALILPTLFGPTNIPPLEAFALGCPVAVSGIYGMPEQVGEAGILFDPYSVEDIAGSIRRLWIDDELCQHLRDKGKARAGAWGPAEFANRLHGIVRQLTHGNN